MGQLILLGEEEAFILDIATNKIRFRMIWDITYGKHLYLWV